MINLKKYRLNQDSELDKFRDPDPGRFYRFQFKVYTLLDSLCIGEKIDIEDKINPSSYEVFVKVVCTYILMHRADGLSASFIEFSDDYAFIYRRPGYIAPHHKKHFYSRN